MVSHDACANNVTIFAWGLTAATVKDLAEDLYKKNLNKLGNSN